MILQSSRRVEAFATSLALVAALIQVRLHVPIEIRLLKELFAAHMTSEVLRAIVYELVAFEVTRGVESLPASATHVSFVDCSTSLSFGFCFVK